MMIELYNGDCLEWLKTIESKSIDLIVTDPPYDIPNTKAGKSAWQESIQKMNTEITQAGLTKGYDHENIIPELIRVMKRINIYIWCNGKQIPMYFDYFVKGQKCTFDVIIWNKSNATPLFNNKYMTDKEYCLYFRKGGYCNPPRHETAKTVYIQPMNVKDKKIYKHPTIKPMNIIKNLVENSSRENEIILDPFMGSGTTGEAAIRLNRRFKGAELNEQFFSTAKQRIEKAQKEQDFINSVLY